MPQPVITSLEAGENGNNQGHFGQTLVIRGTDLAGATQVHIGGRTVVGTVDPSGTFITCLVPVGAGIVNVSVTGPDGTSAPPLPFYYIAAPVVLSVAPVGGSATAPPVITLLGQNLLTVRHVRIGPTEEDATEARFTSVSNTEVTAIPPAVPLMGGPPWTQLENVYTTTAGGEVVFPATPTLPAGFTYYDAPVITSLVPSSGIPGSQILVNGTAFVSPLIVAHFSEDSTTPIPGTVVVNSSAQLLVTVPPGLSTDSTFVRIITLAGQSNAMRFTYIPPPT
ncbi:IPT/TIG domain-containing protein [Actinomadura sp. WMMA1423]|uniref:IPT/TIG domain-containing protein n=1 Tax=Actinomadura sp. WMMA1423 TaxID=2591108 RepID=UPI00143D439A|nr:IPT/TIG domain-containing protein [Actinomadura sp. WMMA1423]